MLSFPLFLLSFLCILTGLLLMVFSILVPELGDYRNAFLLLILGGFGCYAAVCWTED